MTDRRKKSDSAGRGSITADEILPLSIVATRLGWGQRTIRRAQRDGLITIPYARMKYCLGADVLDFFRQRANSKLRADGHGGECQ